MAVQSFNDDRAGIPAPRMQPVWQKAHRVTADQTQKTPDPDDDPTRFHQSSDLTGIHTVSNQLQYAFRIPGGLAADDTKLGTKIIQRRGIRTSSAELLDSDR